MTTLISFYTNDWKYPQHAERLKLECDSIEQPHIIEELPTTGSYLKNTCLKPRFILDKLNELRSPVLWVDVDASIFKKPVFFLDDGVSVIDFAAKMMVPERKRTWHVGTMWFNYTPPMIKFIESWIENTGNLSDESALEKTWSQVGETIICLDLTPDYFYIEQRGKQPPDDTIIMHRISDSQMKKREMPIAAQKRQRGEW